MSKFVKDLVELSKHDKVERFRMDSVPMDINTENFDRVGELLVGDRWLKEFVGPPLDDTPESRKRYSQSIGRKRRRFRMVLARNLAVGIYDCDFIEKLTTLDCGSSKGEWMIGVNWEEGRGKFRAQCSNPFTKKSEYLGRFTCELEAHKTWLKRKLELAHLLAAEQTDKRVAKALIERYTNYLFKEIV